jgi:transketolase
MKQDNLKKRFESFGWYVIEVEDGNDVSQLKIAYSKAKELKGKPTLIIANTIKGKGSKVMENKANWHHKVPTKDEYKEIIKDFEERKEFIGE